MSAYKVVLTDHIFPNLELEERMLKEADAELIAVPDNLDEAVRDADAVVSTYVRITADLIDKMERCRLVIRNGVGVETIDMDACAKKGIRVANVPHYCSDEVATHTMALILALCRRLKRLDHSVSDGKWAPSAAAPIWSLPGRVLGIVGFGKIPRLVAERARVFGLQVWAYDPFVTEAEMEACFVRKMEFDELTRGSDIVSVHCPLTPQTRGLFQIPVFERMKRDAFLVNTARGPVINEQDLITALERGLIAGAGLDVLEHNAPQKDNPLQRMENVIITPHVAWYSEESMLRRRTQTMETVIQALTDGARNQKKGNLGQ